MVHRTEEDHAKCAIGQGCSCSWRYYCCVRYLRDLVIRVSLHSFLLHLHAQYVIRASCTSAIQVSVYLHL